MFFFQQKDYDIHNQRPFFVNKMKIPKKWQIPLNIVFFLKKIVIFPNSASSAEALLFYLPGECTHTDTKGKQRKVRVWKILKSLEKNTIFNEHPVCKNN